MTALWDPALTEWLQLLVDSATPGPWDVENGQLISLHPSTKDRELADDWSWEGDAILVAAAREAIPDLLASLAAAERWRKALADIVALEPEAFTDASDLGVAAQHIAERSLG